MKNIFLVLLFSLSGVVSADPIAPGNVVGKNIFGLAIDVNADPLLILERALIFNTASFEQRLQREDEAWVISGFGDALGGLYLTRIDRETGDYLDTRSFDIAAVDGLSSPRGGITTTWGSVLFAESQMPDASRPLGFIDDFKAFYKGESDMVKPYNYGWVTEAILLDKDAGTKVIKNYAVGRVSASSLFMMPDGRTLYLHDAENSGSLYMFIAKDKNSLADGTLYGINIEGGSPDYTELGSASALKMKFKLRKVEFDDLFDKSAVESGLCASGYSFISTVYGDECLKLKKKNRRYAGLFEPLRTHALKLDGIDVSEFESVVFSDDQSTARLKQKGVEDASYQLGKDGQMDSEYVLK